MPALHHELDKAAAQHMNDLGAEAIEQMPVETPSDHRFRETARSIARRPDPDGVVRLCGIEFDDAEILEAYLDGIAAEAVEDFLMRDIAIQVHDAAEAVVAEERRLQLAA